MLVCTLWNKKQTSLFCPSLGFHYICKVILMEGKINLKGDGCSVENAW